MKVEEIPGQAGDDELFYWFKIGVWFVWIEDLVAVHYCYEVFGVGEVDDVVGVAWKHVNSLDLVTRHLKVEDFIRAYPSLLNQATAAHYDEELPFGIVPMLAFGDAWLADIDRYLTTVQCVDKFSKRTSVVNIHLQWERDFLFWKITEICAVEFLCKRVLWDLRDHESLWLVCEAVDKVNDLTKGDFVGYWAVAVTAERFFASLRMTVEKLRMTVRRLARNDSWNYIYSVVITAMFITLESSNHFVHEIIDVKKFHLHRTIIHLDWEVVGDVVAESCYG